MIRIFIPYLLKRHSSVANRGILSVTSEGTIMFDIISAAEVKSVLSKIETTQIIKIIMTEITMAAVK